MTEMIADAVLADALREMEGPAARAALGIEVPAAGLLGQLASEIEERNVDWLYRNILARGKLAEITGDPSAAKTTVAIDIAARISNGRGFPDAHENVPAGTVVFLSAEDDGAGTLKPRLRVAGANLSCVRIVPGAMAGDDGAVPLTFPDHVKLLEETVRADGAVMLVIDPLTAFLADKIDSHKDASARRVLAELAAMAQRTNCAVLMIRHLNKLSGVDRAMYRSGGSIAFTAACRTSFLVAYDPLDKAPEHERRRVIAAIKNNLGPLAPSLAFRLRADEGESVAHVEWCAEPCSFTANDLLRTHNKRNADALDEAVSFLEGELAEGPRLTSEIERKARNLKISEATLNRARKIAGVESFKEKNSTAGTISSLSVIAKKKR